jgi:hypothetical protein
LAGKAHEEKKTFSKTLNATEHVLNPLCYNKYSSTIDALQYFEEYSKVLGWPAILYSPCKRHSLLLKIIMVVNFSVLHVTGGGVRPESIEMRKSSIRPILGIQQASASRMPEMATTEF